GGSPQGGSAFMGSAILGQARALGRLQGMLRSGRLPEALLFCGPMGVGKALCAKEFAKALNCAGGSHGAFAAGASVGAPCGECPSCIQAEKGLDLDIQVVNSAYQASITQEDPAKQRGIKIDTLRHVIKDLELRSMLGRWKTAIVEDAHLLSTEAANAMLKSLEEPPARALWILVTHQSERLLSTIRSRCQRVPFSPLPEETLARFLEDRGCAPEEAASLARRGGGSPGRALALRESPLPDPADWAGDPLAPFRLADSLPRELHLARPLVEAQLAHMAWHLRGREDGLSFRSRAALRELTSLRKALFSNADPRLVLELAALKLQQSAAP
ncbi:MAG: DNA polymerase III subunit, partial [Elusimicrobiota bacterium]